MSTRASSNAQRSQAAKVHSYVNRQLDKTRRQVKSTELITHLLVVTIFVVGFLQLMALIDAWVWSFNSIARWLSFIVLVGTAVGYLLLTVGPLLLRKIHPDYAAKMIEDVQPTFKNSLLNYVSLRKQPKATHAAVMDAVTKQAAIDLQTVPEDATVDRSSIVQIGFYLLGLIAFVAFYWMLSPKDPLQSFSRILLPSAKKSAPSIVQVTDVSPGDQEVFFGDPVVVSATIKGQFSPDDVKIVYSTRDGQVVDQVLPMQQQTTSSNRFEATLTSGEGGVVRGLVYKVIARDGASPDYEIVVRPNPSITLTTAEITPPAYTLLPQETVSGQGTIEVVEGSLIKVNAVANLPIKLAYIELLVKHPKDNTEFVVVETVSMRANELEAHGEFHAIYNYQAQKQRATHFRLKFLSSEGDANQNANVHPLRIIADLAPQIEVLNPIQNVIRMPINETLLIDVRATDTDYGISSIELEMQNNGTNLFRKQKLPLQSEEGKKRVRGQFQFTPEKYFLRVGETVLFTATASDNRTSYLSGSLDPNQTMTRPYQIEILDAVDNPKRSAKSDPNKGEEDPQKQEPSEQDQQSESENGESGESGEAGSSSGGDTSEQSESGDEGESGATGESGESGDEGGDPSEAGDSESQGQQGGDQGGSSESDGGDGAMESDPKNGGQESGDSQDAGSENTGSEGGGESSAQQEPTGDGSQENGSQGSNTQGNESQSQTPNSDAQDSGDQSAGSEGGSQGDQNGGEQQGGDEGADGARKPLGDDAADGDVMSRMEEIMKEEKSKEGGAAGEKAGGEDQQSAEQNTGRGTDPNQENPRQSEGTGSTQQDDHQPPKDAQGGDNNAQRGDGQSSSSQGEKNGTAKGSSGNETGDQSQEGASSENSNTGQSDETGGTDPGNAASDSPQENQQQASESGNGESGKSGKSSQEGAKPSQEAGEGSNGQQQSGGDEAGEQGGGEQGGGEQGGGEQGGGEQGGGEQGGGEQGGGEQGGGEQGGGEQGGGEQGGGEQGGGEQGGDPSGEGGKGEGQSSGSQQSSESQSSSSQGKAGGSEGNGPGGETIAEKENTEHSKKATDMVLKRLEQERFEPDPELLEELNWSKEDLNQFLDRWQQMKAAAGTGDPVAQQRYEKALKSLGLSSDSSQQKVRGVSDKQEGFNTDSAVNRPPQEIAPGYRAFKRARNRSKN